MPRRITRALVAATAVAALAGGLLVTAPAATAVPPTVQNLQGVPKPPGTVEITWDAYTAFTVDHYEILVMPGSRYQEALATETSIDFNNLTWGTKYTATVVAVEDVTGTKSDPVDLVLPGRKLSAKINKVYTLRGDTVRVAGTLLDHKNKPVAGKVIKVQVALAPYKPPAYQTIGKTKTNRNGAFKFDTKADRNAIYRVLNTQKNTAGGWDANMVLNVGVPVSMRFSSNPVPFGQALTVKGGLNCPADLVAGVPVKLQQRINGTWKTYKATKANSRGKYAITFTPPSRTDRAWRVFTQGGPVFHTSVSKAKALTVR
jgi:hypothetical protein